MVEFGTNRRNPVTGKSIITKLLTECIHNTICRNDQAGCERMNGMYIIRISLHGIFECHVLNIFQWWSEGTFSLIFSSLLRMSKNEGLWFMSAAQHSLVNLRKIQEKKNNKKRYHWTSLKQRAKGMFDTNAHFPKSWVISLYLCSGIQQTQVLQCVVAVKMLVSNK